VCKNLLKNFHPCGKNFRKPQRGFFDSHCIYGRRQISTVRTDNQWVCPWLCPNE